MLIGLYSSTTNSISWSSKKQGAVALSSCEAEYIAASLAACQGLWLQMLVDELKLDNEERIELLVDNVSAINLAKHPVAHDRSKHACREKFSFPA